MAYALKQRLAGSSEKREQLYQLLDVESEEDIKSALLGWADMDDLSPNQIKATMRAKLEHYEKGSHELRPFLREVLNRLFGSRKVRRPNVGRNRHWPRLLQYLRELEGETDFSPEGRGLRLIYAGGSACGTANPDLDVLYLAIDPDHL